MNVAPDAAAVRGVPDAQQALDMPSAQPVEPDIEQFDVVHQDQLDDSVGVLREEFGHITPERIDAAGTQPAVGTLARDIPDLKIALPRNDDRKTSPTWPPGQLADLLAFTTREPKPPGISVQQGPPGIVVSPAGPGSGGRSWRTSRG